jgi:hypothetical protein
LDEQGKIYWHESFFEGLKLVLYPYKDVLTFENEHQLSKEALKIDVLVVKKEKGVIIEKDIGRIFKGHNLFEFKSEKDSLSIRDYNKVIGYANLYSSFLDVPLSDITVSFALTVFPRELVKYLETEMNQTVQKSGDGIYYVEGEKFPVQILESKELSHENLFLRNLRSNLSVADVTETLKAYDELKAIEKKDVYLDRLFQANLIALGRR